MLYLPETKNDILSAAVGDPWVLLLTAAAVVFGFFMLKQWKNR